MKKLYLTFFLSFYTFFGICQTVISGKVIRVADGDTITILDSLNRQKLAALRSLDIFILSLEAIESNYPESAKAR